MFRPCMWPSSGCNLTYRAAIQDVWVFLRLFGIGGLLNCWCITWPLCVTRSRQTNNYLRHGRLYHQNIRPRPNILSAQQAAGFYVQRDETPISVKHGYDVVRCKAVRLLMGWQWPLGRLSANINESRFLAVKALYGLQVPIVYNFNVTHQ